MKCPEGMDIAAALAAEHERLDAGTGWATTERRPHPVCGYTTRRVIPGAGGLAEVITTGERIDGGPSKVVYGQDGKVVTAYWHDASGRDHRADGPSSMTRTGEIFFSVDGDAVVLREGATPIPTALSLTAGRFTELERRLGDGALALAWLRVQAAGASEGSVEAALAAGGDPALALEAARVGVSDGGELVAVATGALPLSWASAGL